MKQLMLVIFLVFILQASIAQSSKDSVLMTERSIDRPLTLHRGQFRIEGGYGLSAVTKRFNNDGDGIKLSDEGISYIRHAWFLDFRYGILENLQLTIASSYKRQSQRIEEVILADANFDVYRIFEIQKKTGLEDLLVALSARAPFTSKALDIVATGGIYIPTGSDQASRPNHTWEEEDGFQNITYRYSSTWGSGVLVATVGGQIKYRTSDYAFTGSMLYDYPLGEGENINWQHQYINNDFEYSAQKYAYQLPSRINFSVEVERQLAPWFDLSFIFQGAKSSGGWDESSGIRVTRPEKDFLSFNPGYEILVTPKLWLRQRLGVSLAGKNTEAPFIINTSLVYNFFPFN